MGVKTKAAMLLTLYGASQLAGIVGEDAQKANEKALDNNISDAGSVMYHNLVLDPQIQAYLVENGYAVPDTQMVFENGEFKILEPLTDEEIVSFATISYIPKKVINYNNNGFEIIPDSQKKHQPQKEEAYSVDPDDNDIGNLLDVPADVKKHLFFGPTIASAASDIEYNQVDGINKYNPDQDGIDTTPTTPKKAADGSGNDNDWIRNILKNIPFIGQLLYGAPAAMSEEDCMNYFAHKAKDPRNNGNIVNDAECVKYESSDTSVNNPLSGAPAQPTPTVTAAPASAATVKATPETRTTSGSTTLLKDPAGFDAGVAYKEVFNYDTTENGVNTCYPTCLEDSFYVGVSGDDMFFKYKLGYDADLDKRMLQFSVGLMDVNGNYKYEIEITEQKVWVSERERDSRGFYMDPRLTDTYKTTLYNGGDTVIIKIDGLYRDIKAEMDKGDDYEMFTHILDLQHPLKEILSQP